MSPRSRAGNQTSPLPRLTQYFAAGPHTYAWGYSETAAAAARDTYHSHMVSACERASLEANGTPCPVAC